MPPSVRFLGSGDAFGTDGRFQACILLEGGFRPVLIDCGATSLVAMKRGNVDPSSIETVLVSHLHGDHFGGLPFMILDGQFAKRNADLVIAGPIGIQERLERTMEAMYPGSVAAARAFETQYVELEERSPIPVGPAVVTAFGVDHASGAPSLALRVEYGGKIVAYSGDTAWTDALVEASVDADLFICEGYTSDKRIRFHMDVETLRANTAKLTCRRLVLTHPGPQMILEADDAGFELAEDGSVFTL